MAATNLPAGAAAAIAILAQCLEESGALVPGAFARRVLANHNKANWEENREVAAVLLELLQHLHKNPRHLHEFVLYSEDAN